MVKHTAIAVVVGALLSGAVLSAQGVAPMRNFQQRIQRGVQDGRITAGERKRLREQIQGWRTEAQKLRQSGKALTPAERLRLRQGLRKINRAIIRAMRNGR